MTHSTEDAGVIEHTLCCSRVLLNVACSSSDTRLKPWVLCSLCHVEKRAPGSGGDTVHMALGVRDWKMSVQERPWRSHLFAGAVTWFMISSWIVCVFLWLYIHTHTYRKNNELQLCITITRGALSGKLLSLRIMDCNDSNLGRNCLMHRRMP